MRISPGPFLKLEQNPQNGPRSCANSTPALTTTEHERFDMVDDLMMRLGKRVQCLPVSDFATSGVYFLYLANAVVYVGQAIDIRKRIGTHLVEAKKAFDSVSCIPCSERAMAGVERFFIAKLRPRYNNCGLVKQLRSIESTGWNPSSDPMIEDVLVTQDDAASLLGINADEVRGLEENGLQVQLRRTPRSRSMVRYYPLSALLAA